MIENTLDTLKKFFELEELDAGAYGVQKVNGMTFRTRHFQVRDVGHLSAMEGSMMAGLMKMQTIILTPLQKDAPLFSYDRIKALGNDTFILEFYDTVLDQSAEKYVEYSRLFAQEKEKLGKLPDHNLGEHWYDPIKLPISVSKRAKKKEALLDAHYRNTLALYGRMLEESAAVDIAAKRERTIAYVNGLFENGGPATDNFVKALGREKAQEMFETVVFGVR